LELRVNSFQPFCELEREQFAEKISHADAGVKIHAPPELLAVLPDNYTVEISPAAENWWREAAGVLGNGKLITLDYGLTTTNCSSPRARTARSAPITAITRR